MNYIMTTTISNNYQIKFLSNCKIKIKYVIHESQVKGFENGHTIKLSQTINGLYIHIVFCYVL